MLKFFAVLLILPFLAQAQSIGIKDIDTTDGDTTIEIKKGKDLQREFEIITNEDELSGDSAPLLKEARANWKKSCTDWKQETKDANKGNQILSLSCGKMECSTASMESTCLSTAKYKVKVQIK